MMHVTQSEQIEKIANRVGLTAPTPFLSSLGADTEKKKGGGEKKETSE